MNYRWKVEGGEGQGIMKIDSKLCGLVKRDGKRCGHGKGVVVGGGMALPALRSTAMGCFRVALKHSMVT